MAIDHSHIPERMRFRFPDGELEEWVALGDVTDRSVRVWGRSPKGPRRIELRVEGARPVEGLLECDAGRDHVGAVVLALPEPRPGTAFTVRADGVARAGRLAPSAGQQASFTFAFGSCHQPFSNRAGGNRLVRHGVADIYPAVRRLLATHDARFLMLVGDQVYSDAVSGRRIRRQLAADARLSDEQLVEVYRHLHRGYFNERGFRELGEMLPAYLTWDDHDIFDGAGSLLHPTGFDERLRAAATVAYVEYQHLRNPGASLGDVPPFDYGFWYGDVAFFVFDLRGCRDFQAERLLGDEQWRRFDGFLAESDERRAQTLFVVASVPVVHASPALMRLLERLPIGTGRDVRDRWTHFPRERTALLERLFAWQTGGPRRQVVILSGDVHVGAAFRLSDRSGRGRIAQWTSSALSTPSGIQHVVANHVVTRLVQMGERPLRIRRVGLVTANNVGLVGVDPDPEGGHVLTLRIFAWDRRQATLREALTERAVPDV